ncbi:MAG: SPOR domain-containing protein [Gammaproteobacteria bacterium]|nr:SPOR domain-containing protein [Gammaproteobacteria bacterium]
MLYLGTLPTPAENEQAQAGEAQAIDQPPKPRFDFYTLLPEQTIEVEVEPAEIAKPRASAASNTSTETYLLQAGSFRQREDADRRRAELLLLGLEPKVEETNGDNGRWYRVYLGPFQSRSTMTKARSLTAGQDIDTLLLKRSKP